jgi:hypothetical protein
MKRFTTILLAVAVGTMLLSTAVAKDTGNRDILRLADARTDDGEFKVAVQVVNDEELAALDIPVRFGNPGDPITLERVEWSSRVADWDFLHAAIDNENKTVILGMISELVNIRPNADLKVSASPEQASVADLVFTVDAGYEVEFSTFKTERPGHELSFIYNLKEGGNWSVETILPEFQVDLSASKAALPKEYALSQNYPNPFNPTTSFKLSLPEASDYSVRVFNVAGQLVKTFQGHADAGELTLVWDGSNDQGGKVASGVYFYRAEAKSFAQTRKMMMLK